ncbi:MAG: PorT family protein [Saprospiraceae bacterium]|nr:PorT family protein [Saprospiraceae bacterium]
MTNNKQNTDKFFHEVALKYEEKPPSYSWTNLADSLAAKKRKRRIVYFRLAAAVIALLFAFSIGYFYSAYKTKKENPQIAKDETKIQLPIEDDDISNDNSFTKDNLTEVQTTKTVKPETTNSNKNKNIAKPKTYKTSTIIENKTQFAYKKKNTNDKLIEDKTENIEITQNPVDKTLFSDTSSSKQAEIPKEKIAVNSEQKPKQDSLKLDYIPDLLNTPDYTNPIAQNEKPKESRWSIGGELAPTYSFRSTNSFTNNNQETASNHLMYAPANSTTTYNEAPVVTYSGGFNTKYELSKRWAFQSGIYYSKFGQTSDFAVRSNADQSIYTNTTAGHLPLDKETVSYKPIFGTAQTTIVENDNSLILYFDYLEIPLAVRYKIIDRKIDLNLMSGIYTGFLVGNNAYIDNNGNKESVGRTEDINTMIYTSMLGFGIEYGISKKVSLNIEPLFKYSLKTINNSGYIYKPYSFGVFTGVSYKL